MNQFKNGTVFIVVATFVTVVLLLLTDRNERNLDGSIVDKQKTSVPVATKMVATPEGEVTFDEKLDNKKVDLLSETEPSKKNEEVANTEISVEAPEGLFQEKAEQVKTDVAKKDAAEQRELKDLDQPIWTQTLGEFVSLEDNNLITSIVPTNTSGLQGDNPSEVVTTKSDRFVANSMPADYNYQEMPMYNGGYYVAPMPSYLMSSVLPKSSVDKK